ncbi:MAG: hypothetical protein ABSD72_09350 [Terracidiphilus sp.]
MLNIPDIIEIFKRVKWNSFHTWIPFHNILVPLIAALTEVTRRWVKRRQARLAQNWPVADGQVQSIDVATGTKFFNSPRQFDASFKYSYSVQEGGEVNYFSGDFSRSFPDKERAWEWLELLKNKRIRAHYKPMHPEVSSVLAADLDAHFSVPARNPDDFVLSPLGTRPE